ncbi:endonuclease/exonuclease/phosphatase family protein [Vibrio nitrifigilis]|nr:endonuclease/exonuclease/phosphatase family protein [Vibrio nitrifigilis]
MMSLSIATINLLNYLAPPDAFYDFLNIYDSAQWQAKTDWLSRQINDINADIIGFQEVFSIEELRLQLLELGYPYFACVDKPTISEEYVYSSPVVALASRFPIHNAQAVTAPTSSAEFSFSRQPLRASIHHPQLGWLDIYVVHFKSKRPIFTDNDNQLNSQTTSKNERSHQDIVDQWQQEWMGECRSTMQRALEFHQLYQAIVQRKLETQYPVLLLGDFNQELSQQEFAPLTSVQCFRQPETEPLILPYRLFDSGTFWYQDSPQRRPATHYHGANGSILDYILYSCEFTPLAEFPIASLSEYKVWDRHLINPHYADDAQASDHAIVSISLIPYL